MKFVTKKTLRTQNAAYAEQVALLKRVQDEIVEYNEAIADKLQDMLNKYPFNVDDVVYELVLKNDKGRFTKTKPSLEHSTIVEVTVTKKNYFSLVDKHSAQLVFTTLDDAEAQLKSICN